MKTVTKKLFSMMLAVIMLLSIVPFQAFAFPTYDICYDTAHNHVDLSYEALDESKHIKVCEESGKKMWAAGTSGIHSGDPANGVACTECGYVKTYTIDITVKNVGGSVIGTHTDVIVPHGSLSLDQVKVMAQKACTKTLDIQSVEQGANPFIGCSDANANIDLVVTAVELDQLTIDVELEDGTFKTPINNDREDGSIVDEALVRSLFAASYPDDEIKSIEKNGSAFASFNITSNATVKVIVKAPAPAPAPEPEPEPTPETRNVTIKEGNNIHSGLTVNVVDGKVDLMALLAADGYPVAEYTVKVNGTECDLGTLGEYPAPAGDITVELVAENTAEPNSSSKYSIVTFVADGGSWRHGETEMDVKVRTGSTLGKEMPSDPTLKGLTFAGWRVIGTDQDFTSKTKVNGDMTVTAVWIGRRETFTITFDPNGGSLHKRDTSMTVHYKEVLKHLPDPTHKRLDFQGWYDQTGRKWEEGDVFNVAQDLTLTAKWAKSAKVVLHIYMDGDTKKAAYNIDLDGYSVGDTITMKHVQKDVWDAGISAKPGKKLEFDGLFDDSTWERYVRRGHGGEHSIEIEDARRNDIYVMVFNGQTSHRPWDPSNPKTGDQMMLEAAIAVMGLTAVGFVVMTTLRKKKVL